MPPSLCVSSHPSAKAQSEFDPTPPTVQRCPVTFRQLAPHVTPSTQVNRASKAWRPGGCQANQLANKTRLATVYLGITLIESSHPRHLTRQPTTPHLDWQSFTYAKEITFCKPGTSENKPPKTEFRMLRECTPKCSMAAFLCTSVKPTTTPFSIKNIHFTRLHPFWKDRY